MSRLAYAFALALVAACGSDDGSHDPAWNAIATDQPSSLLAVTGTSADDVWVVGGRTELQGAPVAWHYDGDTWSDVDPGVTGVNLWWVLASPTSDTMYFGGSGGTILRETNGTFERMATPPRGPAGDKGIIFGIWGASDTDLWAVGDGQGTGPIVWRFDGTAWSEQLIPAPAPRQFFKVHGQSASDVWICGDAGVTLHWDGSTLTSIATGVPGPLFSIITTAADAVAVGGANAESYLLEATGTTWARVTLDTGSALWRGVAAGTDVVYAVGESGVVGARTSGAWALLDQPLVRDSFHSAWVDPDGGLWGVGGDFARIPLTSAGFAVHYGTDSIPSKN